MSIQTIRSSLQDYAKDVKLNLGSVLSEEGATGLSAKQILGCALASAYACKDQNLVDAILADNNGTLTEQDLTAVKIATTIMAMNNTYYRTLHIMKGGADYLQMPANLRMNKMKDHGIDQLDYELYALAVSCVNGCGMCIDAHVKQLEKAGADKTAIQSCFRIASVIVSASQALFID